MPQLRLTMQARRDLLDIWLGIADDNLAAADRIYGRLETRVMVLTQFPKVGPARPQIAPECRVLIEAPYLILYRILGDVVEIVRVLHGARDIDGRLFSEGLE